MKARANFEIVCPKQNLHNYLDIICFLIPPLAGRVNSPSLAAESFIIPISMVIERRKGERSFLIEDTKNRVRINLTPFCILTYNFQRRLAYPFI